MQNKPEAAQFSNCVTNSFCNEEQNDANLNYRTTSTGKSSDKNEINDKFNN